MIGALRKKLLEHFTAIFGISNNKNKEKMMENRGFWEVLEPIRALCTNKDGHSYIRIGFRELHSEKNYSDDCSKHYSENYVHGTTFREL